MKILKEMLAMNLPKEYLDALKYAIETIREYHRIDDEELRY